MAVVTKQINNIPLSVPGQGMTEIVNRVSQWHKSNAVAYTEASGTINLFELPGNSIVLRSGVNVTTAFGASGSAAAPTGTLIIPNDTGTVIVWDALITKLQSTGWSPSTADNIIVPSSGGMFAFSYTTSTSGVSTNATGSFEAYIEYLQMADLL